MGKKFDSIAILCIGNDAPHRIRVCAKHRLVLFVETAGWEAKLDAWLRKQCEKKRKTKLSLICSPTKERIDVETRIHEKWKVNVVVFPREVGNYSNISIGVHAGHYEYIERK
jgi:hypothetical protein